MDMKKSTRWNWFATGNKRKKNNNFSPERNPMHLVNDDIRRWFSAIDD